MTSLAICDLWKAKLHRYSWSRCSNNELKDVIKNYECLKKKPVKSLKQSKDQKYTRNITPIGPNTFSPIIEKGKNEMYNYTLDEQCQFAFGNEFSWCDTITSENSECQVILTFLRSNQMTSMSSVVYISSFHPHKCVGWPNLRIPRWKREQIYTTVIIWVQMIFQSRFFYLL